MVLMAGTNMVVDLNSSTGNGSSNPSTFAIVNDHLLFNAFNENEGFTVAHTMNTSDEITVLSLNTLTENNCIKWKPVIF